MATVGAALTTTVMVALALLPPASVTEAVRVWVPELSVVTLRGVPVPRLPSRSDDQAMAAARLPSSGPLAGPVMATVGAALTTTVMVALADLPPASVTEAVRVWVPELSVVTLRGVPVPRVPSRLDDQAMAAARLPSSGSLAVPVKVTVLPGA